MSQFPSHPDEQSSILGAPSTVIDPLWYPDSGASHHITNDSEVFINKSSYQGVDQVRIGNGTGMHIAHIDTAKYTSSH